MFKGYIYLMLKRATYLVSFVLLAQAGAVSAAADKACTEKKMALQSSQLKLLQDEIAALSNKKSDASKKSVTKKRVPKRKMRAKKKPIVQKRTMILM